MMAIAVPWGIWVVWSSWCHSTSGVRVGEAAGAQLMPSRHRRTWCATLIVIASAAAACGGTGGSSRHVATYASRADLTWLQHPFTEGGSPPIQAADNATGLNFGAGYSPQTGTSPADELLHQLQTKMAVDSNQEAVRIFKQQVAPLVAAAKAAILVREEAARAARLAERANARAALERAILAKTAQEDAQRAAARAALELQLATQRAEQEAEQRLQREMQHHRSPPSGSGYPRARSTFP